MRTHHWRDAEPGWPRLWLYLCHHGPAWVQQRARWFVQAQISDEIEAERIGVILGLTWQTGQPVVGEIDAEGRLIVTVGDGEPHAVILPHEPP